MTHTNDDIPGRLLSDVAPELHAEFMLLLDDGQICIHNAQLNDNERQILRERLRGARVSERCTCGQSDCRTYYIEHVESHPPARPAVVRFYVRGEALLHVDANGEIYKLERLYDEAWKQTTRYVRVGNAWINMG